MKNNFTQCKIRVPNFCGDSQDIIVTGYSDTGIVYTHPQLGICGARFDSMTKHEKETFDNTVKTLATYMPINKNKTTK